MESKCHYTRIDKSTHISWKITGTLSLLMFGGGNYMLSLEATNPLNLKAIISLGYLIFMLTLGLFHIYVLRKQNGYWPSLYPNSIFSKDYGLTPGFFVGIIGGVLLFLAQFALILGWYFDPLGTGVIYLMIAGTTPLTALLSYFVYSEKSTVIQIIGMIVSLAGIIYIGVDRLQGSWIAYVCGLASLVLFSIRNLSGRSMENSGLDIYTAGMLNALGEVGTAIFLIFYMGFYTDREKFLVFNNFWMMIAGGVFIAYGQYYANQAIMTGNIGVVITLCNSSSMLFIILQFLHVNIIPPLDILAACVSVILGVVIMLFGDSWVRKCGPKSESVEVF